VSASETVVSATGLGVLPACVCVAPTTAHANNGLINSHTHIPAPSTTTGALLQVAPETVIAAPGTPSPETTTSFVFTGLILGLADVVAGFVTVVVVEPLSLPAESV
jgi:hypothetical protein